MKSACFERIMKSEPMFRSVEEWWCSPSSAASRTDGAIPAVRMAVAASCMRLGWILAGWTRLVGPRSCLIAKKGIILTGLLGIMMGPIGLGNRFQPTSIMRWENGVFLMAQLGLEIWLVSAISKKDLVDQILSWKSVLLGFQWFFMRKSSGGKSPFSPQWP